MATLQPVDMRFFDSAPVIVRYEATVRAPAELVWRAALDPAPWVRGCRSCTWTTTATEAVGARRELRLTLGRLDEEIIEWTPGRGFAFAIRAASPPIARRMAESVVVDPLEPGASGSPSGAGDGANRGPLTRFAWRQAVDPLPGLPNTLVRAAFARTLGVMFGGLPAHLDRLAGGQGQA